MENPPSEQAPNKALTEATQQNLLTISSTNKAEPLDPAKLLLGGFYVFPIFEYRKYPTKVGTRPWSWFWDHGNLQDLTAEALLLTESNSLTGWALAPHKTDPTKLILLDVDDYSGTRTPQDVWQELASGEMPQGLGVVRSPSGGFHFYMAMPSTVQPSQLPHSFDFGNGIKGEIRFSGQGGIKFLILPGSRTLNHDSKVRRYEAQKDFNLAELPDAPAELIQRLTARVGTEEREEDAQISDNLATALEKGYKRPPSRKEIVESEMPTEFHHLMGILQHAEIDEGGRNNFAAAVAQIVGRFYRKRPNEVAMRIMASAVQGAVDPPLPKSELMRTLYSGLKRGQENSKKHDAYIKHPSMSLVLTEARALFGSIPWLMIHLNQEGKPVAYELGIGGTAAARTPDSKSMTIVDFTQQSVLAALARLTGVDQDVLVRSPLFISVNWIKVLMHWLRSTAEIEYIALPTEAIFWDLIQQWALQASDHEHFTSGITQMHPESNALCNTRAKIVSDEKQEYRRMILVIHPINHEFLMMSCGDIGATKKLLRTHVDERKVLYTKKRANAWCVEINETNLGEETMRYIHSKHADKMMKGKEVDPNNG